MRLRLEELNLGKPNNVATLWVVLAGWVVTGLGVLGVIGWVVEGGCKL